MRKKGTKNKNYRAEFKIFVIMDKHKNHLTYHETVRKHQQTNSLTQKDLYFKIVKKWDRIYTEEGGQGLMTEQRGRKSTGRSRKQPLEKETENDLIAENQRLRMQIKYLKKLDALVRKKEQEKDKNQ